MDRRRDRAGGAPGLERVQHLLCAAGRRKPGRMNE